VYSTVLESSSSFCTVSEAVSERDSAKENENDDDAVCDPTDRLLVGEKELEFDTVKNPVGDWVLEGLLSAEGDTVTERLAVVVLENVRFGEAENVQSGETETDSDFVRCADGDVESVTDKVHVGLLAIVNENCALVSEKVVEKVASDSVDVIVSDCLPETVWLIVSVPFRRVTVTVSIADIETVVVPPVIFWDTVSVWL
jgi:hypothetical protein